MAKKRKTSPLPRSVSLSLRPLRSRHCGSPKKNLVIAEAAAATAPEGWPGGEDYLFRVWSTSLSSLVRQRLRGTGARSGRARQRQRRSPASLSTVGGEEEEDQERKGKINEELG